MVDPWLGVDLTFLSLNVTVSLLNDQSGLGEFVDDRVGLFDYDVIFEAKRISRLNNKASSTHWPAQFGLADNGTAVFGVPVVEENGNEVPNGRDWVCRWLCCSPCNTLIALSMAD